MALIGVTVLLLPPLKFARCWYCWTQFSSQKYQHDFAVTMILFQVHDYRFSFVPGRFPYQIKRLNSLLFGTVNFRKIWSACGQREISIHKMKNVNKFTYNYLYQFICVSFCIYIMGSKNILIIVGKNITNAVNVG